MTVHATRRQLVPPRSGFAVQGLGIKILLLRVAASALYFGGRSMRKILALEIGMASGAAYGTVNRRRKLLAVHEQGNRLSTVLGGHALVAMASQAGITRIRRMSGQSGRREDKRESHKQNQ